MPSFILCIKRNTIRYEAKWLFYIFTKPDTALQINDTFIQIKNTFIQKVETIIQNKKDPYSLKRLFYSI